ncbi:hypothetical protein ACRQNL_003607 [Salmonella enterica subsp. enterica serovar Oranienburg]|nr:hypothetical protein [Salmonella enterica]
MQKFLSLLFSRRALAVVGVLVLALLVWFVGPLVSFDTLRPLASVGSRVTAGGPSSSMSIRSRAISSHPFPPAHAACVCPLSKTVTATKSAFFITAWAI